MLTVLVDFYDYNKARRNVIICSVAVFLTASASLASDRLSIFGLEILVSQIRIVLTLQVALTFLFTVFFLYALARAPSLLLREFNRIDRIWEKNAKEQVREMQREIAGDDGPYDSPYDDFDGFYYEGLDQRRTRRERLFSVGYFLQRLVPFLVSFCVPVFLFCLAIYKPSALDKIVNSFAEVQTVATPFTREDIPCATTELRYAATVKGMSLTCASPP